MMMMMMAMLYDHNHDHDPNQYEKLLITIFDEHSSIDIDICMLHFYRLLIL